MSDIRTTELFFTKNKKFCFRNMYGLVKASCSGYNYKFFDFLDAEYSSIPKETHSPFISIRNKLKLFESLVINGITNNELFFDVLDYSYVSDNITVCVKLRVFDTVIMSHEVKHKFESIDKAIEHTKQELLDKWNIIHKNVVNEEFISDLAELIEIFNYAIEHGDFEVYDN